MTDDQIRALCEDVRQNSGRYVRTCAYDPRIGQAVPWLYKTKDAAIRAEREGLQVWAKVRGEWTRALPPDRKPTDSEMLEWLCQDGRYVSHSRDGECCNVWHDNPTEGAAQRSVPVEGFPQKSYRTAREAIIAAMAYKR